MEHEFLSFEEEEEDGASCCPLLLLRDCLPACRQLCEEALATACCLSRCCCCPPVFSSGGDEKKSNKPKKPPAAFPRVEYRPLIDSNILTGNTLLHTAGGEYYFPQTHQTLWPKHGTTRLRPIKTSPVVSEQPAPFGDEHVRRSTRLLSALTPRKLQGFRSGKLRHDPTSPLPSLAHSSIEDPDQPTLTFATMHDIQSSTLTVFLKFASNLNYLFDKPHKQPVVHASVSLFLFPSKNEILQTQSDSSLESNNPVFNDQFLFSGVPVSELFEQTLVFQVYNGRVLIGTARIQLSSADLLGYTVCKHIDRVTEYTDGEVSQIQRYSIHSGNFSKLQYMFPLISLTTCGASFRVN